MCTGVRFSDDEGNTYFIIIIVREFDLTQQIEA